MKFLMRTFCILYSYLNADDKHLFPPCRKISIVQDDIKMFIFCMQERKNQCIKTTNLQSCRERDEKIPQGAGRQSVSVPPCTTIVPEEALTQDRTVRLSHGDVNLHL